MSKIKFTTQQPTPIGVALGDVAVGNTFQFDGDIFMKISVLAHGLAYLNLKTGQAWKITDPDAKVQPIEITAQYQPTSP
jgi:hypothetical protein